MFILETAIYILALYGLFHLSIKIFGEKEVDDEMTAAEKKLEDAGKTVLTKIEDRINKK